MLSNSCVEKPTTMTAIENNGLAGVAELVGQEIFFPFGLLGFTNSRRFNLSRLEVGGDSDSPFFVLNSLDQELSFLVIHPDWVTAEYTVPWSPELLGQLDAKSASELVALLIVTVRDRIEDITVNLQGPVLIGAASHRAMQLVLEEYPLRHPLVVAR
jgi:flagellar assembly factor FliW